MPLYEFFCDECGNKREIVLRINERNRVQDCNLCGVPLIRVISCKIERVNPTYIESMSQMLPPKERGRVHDRKSFKEALDRSGLVTI